MSAIVRVRMLPMGLLIGAAPALAQTLPAGPPVSPEQAAPKPDLLPDEIEARRRAIAARREAARAEFRANNPGSVPRDVGGRAPPASGGQASSAMDEPADDQDFTRPSGAGSRPSRQAEDWDDREPQPSRDRFGDSAHAQGTRFDTAPDRYRDQRAADGVRSGDGTGRYGGYRDRTGDDDRDDGRRVWTTAGGRRAWSEADDPRYRFGAEWVWDPAFRYDRRWQVRAGGVAGGSSAGVPLADIVRFDPIIARWALTRFDRSDRGALSGADLDRAARALGALADEDDDGRLDDREYRSALNQLRRLGIPERGRDYSLDER